MSETPRNSLTPPQQSRSRKTLERIVQAAKEILAEEGPGGVTVQAVVSRASSSVGSFYARFRGKDELLDYLAQRIWEDARAQWDAAIASKTWSDMELPDVTEGAVDLLTAIPQFGIAGLEALDQIGSGDNSYETLRQHMLGSLAELLLEHQAGMVHDQPRLAVRLGLHAVLGVVDAGIVDSEGQGVPKDALVHECTELLLGYLTGASRSAGGQVDFFDVWG